MIKTIYHELADELFDETKLIIQELVDTEIKPMADYYSQKMVDAFYPGTTFLAILSLLLFISSS